MKTQKEIEQLAYEYAIIDFDDYAFSGFIKGYTQCQEDMADTSKVTRFEVIDENGRAYTQRDCNVELSYQDDGRTLKVFIKPLDKQE